MLRIAGYPKPKFWRCLRSYCRIAHIEHNCCKCNIPIYPGMEYEARVMVWGNTLKVMKSHSYCPVDPDEEVRLREEAEKNSQEEKAWKNVA